MYAYCVDIERRAKDGESLKIINKECNDCGRAGFEAMGVLGEPTILMSRARLYIKHSALTVAYIGTSETRTHTHFSRHERKVHSNVSTLHSRY